MKTRRKLSLALLIMFLFSTTCLLISRIFQNRIDDEGKEVAFQDLPNEVRQSYLDYYSRSVNPSIEILPIGDSLNVNVKAYTLNDNMLEFLVNGFVYKINISGKEVILTANKGMPLVTNGKILVHPKEFWVSLKRLDSLGYIVYTL